MGCHASVNTVLAVEDVGPAADIPAPGRGAERRASTTSEACPARHPTLDRRQSGQSRASTPGSTIFQPDFVVTVEKRQGDLLGAGLGNTDKGAVIFNVQEGGLLDKWNKANPDQLLRSGLIIEEVNEVSGYWNMLEELRKHGPLRMKISATPPPNAKANWFEDIANIGKSLEAQGGKSSFMLRLQPQDPKAKNQTFSSLPNIRAGDCGVEQCVICLEDVAANEILVQLPCQHAFHALCAARWLTQAGRSSQGKRQCCPLCCRKVVSTPDGGICSLEK